MSVLIVDDEKELSTLFKEFVNAIGMDADSFTNPILAFEHFKGNSNKYSLIISDLRMPGICGLELANSIRKINTSVKIFLMTAFDTSDLENNPTFQSAKIDKLLQKPIKMSYLKRIIGEMLGN